MNKNKLLKELGQFKSVENITSSRGNYIPNQFILDFTGGSLFQSYNSTIVVKLKTTNIYYLGCDWKYSKTTGKYRNLFLCNELKDVKADLKTGKAVLIEDL